MAESTQSDRSGDQDPIVVAGIFTANYNAVVGRGVENNVNLGSSGAAVFISHNAASAMAGIGTLRAEAYVVQGDALQPPPIIRPAVDDDSDVPIDAERFLAWITKPDRLEFVLDTFAVNFQKRVLRDGVFAARQWYRWQVVRTFGEAIVQLSPRIAAVVYLVRRTVSFLFGSS